MTSETRDNQQPCTACSEEVPVAAPAEEVSIGAIPDSGAPEAPAATQAPAKPKKVKRRRNGFVRFLCALVSIVLVLGMFGSAVIFTAVLDLRTTTSKENISKIMEAILMGSPTDVPFRPTVSTLTAGLPIPSDDATEGGDTSDLIVDWIYGMVQEQLGDELEITHEQVTDFVEQSTVKEFVVDKVSGMMEDMITGEITTTVTVEEISDMIKENTELIEESFGVPITDELVDMASDWADESGVLDIIEKEGIVGVLTQAGNAGSETTPSGDGATVAPGADGSTGTQSGTQGSTGNLIDAIGDIADAGGVMSFQLILNAVRAFASTSTLLTAILAFLVLAVLQFFVSGRSLSATFVAAGIPLTLTGLIFMIPTWAVSSASAALEAMLSGVAGMGYAVKAVVVLFEMTTPINMTVLCLGAGLIVASIVTKVIVSKKNAV